MGEGDRFCILHRPQQGTAERGALLFVHPFAEEMNKSRRMAALQSRACAQAGWIVLQIDLYGCGDSAGDFSDATWEGWIDDVERAAGWLRESTRHEPILWGLRLGCPLALEAADRMERRTDLLFWQPVISGKQALQQFLRLKVVNRLLGDRSEGATGMQELRQQLAEGRKIEVAGYTLSPQLALGMEAAELRVLPIACRAGWLELSNATPGANSLSPAAQNRVQAWRAAGHTVDARTVQGPAFWQTLEVEECPSLVAETLSVLKGWQQ